MKRITAALLLLAGCSTTATIARTNAAPLDAEIRYSDSEALHVVSESGQPLKVPRSQVIDIDHPGNGAAVTGTVFTGLAVLSLVSVGIVGALIPAAIGLPPLIWGYSTWSHSKNAAAGYGPPAGQKQPETVPDVPAAPAPATTTE